MRRSCAARALVLLPLLAGCDFSYSLVVTSDDWEPPPPPPPAASESVASDPSTDGDVRDDGAVAATAVIRAGCEPLSPPPVPEFRGFISFPLDRIPVGAWIESATVIVTVDRVELSGPALFLSFERVRYGDPLTSAAYDAPGSPVGGLPGGATLVPAPGPQSVAFDVVPELQGDVNDPDARFFQLRARGNGGLAWIVDGAGNRAGGLPPDRALVPVLCVVFRH